MVVIEPIRNEEAEEKNKRTIVHHVSSTWLTDTQVRVWRKGLKFTPIPRRNAIEMEKDIHNFTRKLRLTEYLANENDVTFDEETQPLIKKKYLSSPPLSNAWYCYWLFKQSTFWQCSD